MVLRTFSFCQKPAVKTECDLLDNLEADGLQAPGEGAQPESLGSSAYLALQAAGLHHPQHPPLSHGEVLAGLG